MIKRNIFSILVALIIMYLSLASSDTFDSVPLIDIPNFDKVVHFCMYFGLMLVIILGNRKVIRTVNQLFLIGLIPLAYGIIMEILQATITSTRSASVYDALADAAGILAIILMCLWIKPIKKQIIRY